MFFKAGSATELYALVKRIAVWGDNRDFRSI